MYRVVVEVLDPYTVLFLVGAVGIANLWRKPREGRPGRGRLLLATLPFAGLLLLSTGAVATLLSAPLERRYPQLEERPADAGAIVVLGGAVRGPDEFRVRPELNDSAMHRCRHAAQLYREGRRCPVVVSGGRMSSDPSDPTVAAVMRDFLIELGVKAADLIEEDDSQTTYENAIECCRLLGRKGISKIVLVTDARHMYRAVACFRAQGMEVVPSGCYHRELSVGSFPYDFLPNAKAAASSQDALHEWIGVLWYRVRGKS